MVLLRDATLSFSKAGEPEAGWRVPRGEATHRVFGRRAGDSWPFQQMAHKQREQELQTSYLVGTASRGHRVDGRYDVP